MADLLPVAFFAWPGGTFPEGVGVASFLGFMASSSIILSAAYTIYMFNRIAFGGTFSKFFEDNISDITKREFFILFILVSFTIIFGIYPTFILNGLHYSVANLIYYI